MNEPYSRKDPAWARMDDIERKEVMAYGERYQAFLDKARTERLAVGEILAKTACWLSSGKNPSMKD